MNVPTKYIVLMIIYRILINPNSKPSNWKHQYVNKNGQNIVVNKNELEIIKSYKIPPAYPKTAINLNHNSKVWALSIDKSGKKQYTYNPTFIQKQINEKYCNLIVFGNLLPKIKKKIDQLINNSDIDNKDVLNAVVLKIILTCHFRVGNNIGVDKYDSYGVTTLLNKQIQVKSNGNIQITFPGKRQVLNECQFNNKKLANILTKLKNNTNKNEPIFNITSNDINEFLKQFDECLSSKFFRTWNSNLLFIKYIQSILSSNNADISTVTNRKKIVKKVVEQVADKLHHTTAICKKAYIHHTLQELFINHPNKFNKLIKDNWKQHGDLLPEEYTLIQFLKQHNNC